MSEETDSAVKVPAPPAGLDEGGRALWTGVVERYSPLTEPQLVQLHEAARMKDRCDRLDLILRGDVDTWARLTLDLSGEVYDVRVTSVMMRAGESAQHMKQLLAALRLPDETGKLPQRRGARGAQAPTVAGGKPKNVSNLDRFRAKRAE